MGKGIKLVRGKGMTARKGTYAVLACDVNYRWVRSGLMSKKKAMEIAKDHAKASTLPVVVVKVLDSWYNIYQGHLSRYDGRLFEVVKTFNY